GYSLPEAVVEAGEAESFEAAMERSVELYGAIDAAFGPTQAAYAVSLAYRIRYVMQMNARAAMHLVELRTGPQGHPEYRRVGQEMHRLIAEQAGHRAVAELMSFVDYGTYDLERLDAERRAEQRRQAHQ
ncbi:MAG: FAD-dependent thymidylate synthase, partial [Actinomycetota bacterium]|nr:FAD-dependent thymidylate synthase [Actinomycetota bacterium]